MLLGCLVVGSPEAAFAQGGVVDAAPVATVPVPAPSGSGAEAPPRPARGPALRERGGRRSRGASTASGAVMIFMLIAAMGYYVVRKLRR